MALKRQTFVAPARRYAPEPEEFVRPDAERVRAVIAKLWAKLAVKPERKHAPRVLAKGLVAVTDGHGDVCTCEHCYPRRLAGFRLPERTEAGEDWEEEGSA